MKREFYNIEVVNFVSEVNKILEDENKTKDMPIKFRWKLKKNLAVFSSTVQTFEEFRKELVEELQSEYFNDEKSHVEKLENEGEEQEFRKINDEYMEEYKEQVNDLNEKLQELLGEKNEYEIDTVDMDEFVNGLPNDTSLEFADIEILSLIGKQ